MPQKRQHKSTSPHDRQQQLLASRRMACQMAQLAHDRHCTDIVVLELAALSPVAKHFVICTGTSEQQIRSVGKEIDELGAENGFGVFGRSGMDQGRWVVLDFVDVVVHLFDTEYRTFYDLELLWGDAPKITWQSDRPAAEPERTDP